MNEAKFEFGQKVRVIKGLFQGSVGKICEIRKTKFWKEEEVYSVLINDDIWYFPESSLEEFQETSESNDEPISRIKKILSDMEYGLDPYDPLEKMDTRELLERVDALKNLVERLK